MKDISDWNPHKPRCCDCQQYLVEEEPRDYAPALFCGIFCTARDLEDDDNSGFPFDAAPEICIETGLYRLNLEDAFWNSPFSDLVGESPEEVEKAFARHFDSFVWVLENIRAVGV